MAKRWRPGGWAGTVVLITFVMTTAPLAAQDAGQLTPPEVDPSRVAVMPRVRANNHAGIAALLRQGRQRSATFRRLVDAIDATDGIVYVEPGRCGHQVRACLALTVRVAGPSRLLRIVVDTGRSPDEMLAAIGHELQHAIEALSDPHVTDDLTIYHFFERIAPTVKGRFETEAAIQVGLDVLAEVRANAR